MSAINVAFNLAGGANAVIPVDRWANPQYTIQLDSGTTILVEGTLQRINRGETPDWNTMFGNTLASPDVRVALTAVAPGLAMVAQGPVEAIRITATDACVGRVMQTGGGGL